MPAPSGFTWSVRKNGDVAVAHHGSQAVTLRGKTAERFLSQAEHSDPQMLLARLTGNYKRGNERTP